MFSGIVCDRVVRYIIIGISNYWDIGPEKLLYFVYIRYTGISNYWDIGPEILLYFVWQSETSNTIILKQTIPLKYVQRHSIIAPLRIEFSRVNTYKV